MNGRLRLESDGTLEMRFDGHTVVLYLAGDGDSVRAAIGDLKTTPAFTLESGDSCVWDRADLSTDGEFGPLIGRTVSRVEAVIESWPGRGGGEVVNGWVVHFTGGDFLAYLNVGDDSRLLVNQLPLHRSPAIRAWVEVVGDGWHVEPGSAVDGKGG